MTSENKCKGCGRCACGKDTTPNMEKSLVFYAPDDSKWAIPVRALAESHAKHHAKDYGGDFDAAMKLHTAPLFDSSEFAITQWASSLHWSDVSSSAVMVSPPSTEVMEEVWALCETQVENLK